MRPLPVWAKLLCQSLAAAVAVGYGIRVSHISLFGGGGFALGVWAMPVSFFWILGITNAFNLLDGLDGLVCGLAIIIAAANALFFFFLGETQMMMLLLVLFGALLGFLPYNFNPATIFLGDSGSLLIGYLLAVTAISGAQNSVTSLAVVMPLLLFGLPIVDTLLSMARRLAASAKMRRASSSRFTDRLKCASAMFAADRRHIHHRLLALGFSHRRAVLALYGIALAMAALAMLSVLAQYRNAGMLLIAVGAAAYLGIRRLGYDEIEFLQAGTLLRWYEQTRMNRQLMRVLIHAMLIASAYWGAFLLKYDQVSSHALYAWPSAGVSHPLGHAVSLFLCHGPASRRVARPWRSRSHQHQRRHLAGQHAVLHPGALERAARRRPAFFRDRHLVAGSADSRRAKRLPGLAHPAPRTPRRRAKRR